MARNCKKKSGDELDTNSDGPETSGDESEASCEGRNQTRKAKDYHK